MCILAQHLEMIPPDPPGEPGHYYREFKWVWWSANVYNDKLWKMLMAMVVMGFLKKGEDYSDLDNHFRWVEGATFK